MKKLTLNLDKLHIHSFETGEACSARGTVAANVADPARPPCETRAWPYCQCTVVDPGLPAPVD